MSSSPRADKGAGDPGSDFIHVTVHFNIIYDEESDARYHSHLRGEVPASFLDASERSHPEIARKLLDELWSDIRNNFDLSDVDSISASTGRGSVPYIYDRRKEEEMENRDVDSGSRARA